MTAALLFDKFARLSCIYVIPLRSATHMIMCMYTRLITRNMKKITLATIKSFIKKNEDLYIKNKSDFDGMVDGVRECSNQSFRKAERKDGLTENTLGIVGAWFVKSSRDGFNEYEDEQYKGYEVYNCCGSFILAVAK